MFKLFSEYYLYDEIEEIIKNTLKTNNTPIGPKPAKGNLPKKEQTSYYELKQFDSQEVLRHCLEILQFTMHQAPHYLKKYIASSRQKILKYPLLASLVESFFHTQTEALNLNLVIK